MTTNSVEKTFFLDANPYITDATRIHPESGVVYVFDPDDGTVITCFRPTDEQLKQGNDAEGERRVVA